MPDRNIKITLQYDGSRYDGWQKQGNTDKTIQGKLEQILEKMAGQTVEVHGSGRTDAGVHAWGDRSQRQNGCRSACVGTGGEFPSSGVLCRDERGGVESVPEPLSPG